MRRGTLLALFSLFSYFAMTGCSPETARPAKMRDLAHAETPDDLADDSSPDLKKGPVTKDFAVDPNADLADVDLADNTVNNDGGTGKDLTFVPVDPSDIRDIQNGTIPTGSEARIEGVVVTGVDPKSNFFFVQEPDGDPKYSGIAIYFGTMTTYTKPKLGDVVSVQGTVKEFATSGNPSSRTDLEDITDFQNTGTGTVPLPVDIATPGDLTKEATAEPYEGVLVKISGPTVLTKPDSFKEFTVTGSLSIDDRLYDYTTPTPPAANDAFTFIEGPLDYNNGHYKILPRSAADMPKGVLPLNLVSLTPSTTSTLTGSTATFTVTVNQAVTGTAATINLSSMDPTTAAPTTTTATIDVGKNSTKFVVNGVKAGAATIIAGLAGSTPATVTATLNVNDPGGPVKLMALGPPTLTIAGTIGTHAASERTGLVNITLTGAAPPGGTVLLLESKNTAAVLSADQITIPEGQSSGSFRVVAVGSTAASSQISATDGDTLLTMMVNVVVTAPASPSATDKELVLNEVLYSPAFSSTDMSIGDASCDNVRDSTKDEYVELVNISAHVVDLNGVSVWDDTNFTTSTTARFKFPSYFLGPGESVVVFGGTRTLPATASTAAWCVTPLVATSTTEGDARVFSSPSIGLSLGNNGDTVTITLADKTKTLDSVTWADGVAPAESWQRSPEHSTSSTWVKHTAFPGAATDLPISPGSYANGLPFSLANPTP